MYLKSWKKEHLKLYLDLQEVESYVQQFRVMEEMQGQSNIVSYDELTVVPHEDGSEGMFLSEWNF